MGYRHTKGIYLDNQKKSIPESSTNQVVVITEQPVVEDTVITTVNEKPNEPETKEVQNALKVLEQIQSESNSVDLDNKKEDTKKKPENKKKVVTKKKKTS